MDATRQQQVQRELVYRTFEFDERSQLFVGTNNETLSVAMRVSNPDCSPLGIQR